MKKQYQDFLLEIGTEEMPPQKIGKLAAALAANIEHCLQVQELKYYEVKIYTTPRRIAILVNDLAIQQANRTEKLRGPPLSIAFDGQDNPTIAAKKFAQSCGVDVYQLSYGEDKKGEFLCYKTVKVGQPTAQLLPSIIKDSIKSLVIARPMHWGDNKISFIRPVHWVVMIFGKESIVTEILGVKTSNKTFGHRFHHPQAIIIPEAKKYEELLAKKGFVIADYEKRQQKIQEQIHAIDDKVLVRENLLAEVNDLVEWPVALVGFFSPHFLKMPSEVLITVMTKHQRYFPMVDQKGKLLPQFIIISNINSKKPKQVIAGNERVIRARLTDAEYFYHSDLRFPLLDYQSRLKTVVFQERLGSLYDKTLRLQTLAGFIARKIGADVVCAERAAALSKCDLLTAMVWEFPELQGIMGDYYARNHEHEAVATALKEQYLPRFAQDQLPATAVGCALALADRIDNLVGFFGINKIPSGEKDPLGLRRAAAGIVHIILEKKLIIDLQELLEQAWSSYVPVLENKEAISQILHFIYERLRYIYAEQGKSIHVFRAVLACMPTDLLDFAERFSAVTKFSQLPEAKDLSEIYKRVNNILVKNDSQTAEFNNKLTLEPAERNLAMIIAKEEAIIFKLYAKKDYFAVLRELVKFKPVLTVFFADVMVMVEEKKIRMNRLALLKKLQQLFTLVADLSWLV